jgi:hypothetical protein
MGHSGFPVTFRTIKQVFAWSGIKSATLAFVQLCTVCQQAKLNRAKYQGLLSPLHVPDGLGKQFCWISLKVCQDLVLQIVY